MLATATHDHKRGEDVRARLAVLSEIPDEWRQAVLRWKQLNAPHRRFTNGPMPSPGDEAMLYQMIVGAWPTEMTTTDTNGLHNFTERLAAWQLKAMREAKLATDWSAPDLDYEDAARSFLYTIMSDTDNFVKQAADVAHRIGPAGAVNGMAQTLLKLTVPGVPDFYQGTEFWDLSLVDPDNRRPVDFTLRRSLLMEAKNLSPGEIWKRRAEGLPKSWLIQKTLKLRERFADFSSLDYEPVFARAIRAENIAAFVRGGKITRLESGGAVVGLLRNLQYERGLVQLDEGDAIYIPPLWWHGVIATSDRVGVTTPAGWRSPRMSSRRAYGRWRRVISTYPAYSNLASFISSWTQRRSWDLNANLKSPGSAVSQTSRFRCGSVWN